MMTHKLCLSKLSCLNLLNEEGQTAYAQANNYPRQSLQVSCAGEKPHDARCFFPSVPRTPSLRLKKVENRELQKMPPKAGCSFLCQTLTSVY